MSLSAESVPPIDFLHHQRLLKTPFHYQLQANDIKHVRGTRNTIIRTQNLGYPSTLSLPKLMPTLCRAEVGISSIDDPAVGLGRLEIYFNFPIPLHFDLESNSCPICTAC